MSFGKIFSYEVSHPLT